MRVTVGLRTCSCAARAPAVIGPWRSIVESAANRVGEIPAWLSRRRVREARNTDSRRWEARPGRSVAVGAAGMTSTIVHIAN